MSGVPHSVIGSETLSAGGEINVVLEVVCLDPPIGSIGIERPEDPGSLIQDWCQRADPTALIPYWAEIWPSSLAIARRIAGLSTLAGSTVLDLGCGLGLAGVAASLAGGRVTFADNHPDALRFARRNALRAGAHDVSFLLVDWRELAWARAYDLVLGADVIYDRMEHEAIADLLEHLLAEGGTAWLGDPCREIARPFLEEWAARGRRSQTRICAASPGEEVPLAIHELDLG